MKKDSFSIKGDDLYVNKRGRSLIFDDSIDVKITNENKKQLFKRSIEEGTHKNNTYINGKVLSEAIAYFTAKYDDYTTELEHTLISFDIKVKDAKFIYLMSRKQGFVNFLLDMYFKETLQENEEEKTKEVEKYE